MDAVYNKDRYYASIILSIPGLVRRRVMVAGIEGTPLNYFVHKYVQSVGKELVPERSLIVIGGNAASAARYEVGQVVKCLDIEKVERNGEVLVGQLSMISEAEFNQWTVIDYNATD